jgi:acetamidase/formamidase
VDEAGLCLADVHGYIGAGELALAGIEVNADVRLCVERSHRWLVDWPVIETVDEIMVFSSYSSAYVHRPRLEYVDVVRQAYRELCQVVAARVGGSVEEANTIVATAADIRNCAIYGLGGYIAEDPRRADTSEIAVVAALAKSVFED